MGVATPVSADRGAFRHRVLSPDGTRIAVAQNDSETRPSDMWIYAGRCSGQGLSGLRASAPNFIDCRYVIQDNR
jgi:hypothetical protein